MKGSRIETDMKAAIEQIDQHIDLMDGILREESRKLNRSFDLYRFRIKSKSANSSVVLIAKLKEAARFLESAQQEGVSLVELLESLQNIKQVNKILRFAILNSDINIVAFSSFIGPISNVCLGQLKYIRSRYELILNLLKDKITGIWMDRELSQILGLVLFVNRLQFNKFMEAFQSAEVLYADLSLMLNSTLDPELHQRVVLRMISNRFSTAEEQQIINTLFPEWNPILKDNEGN